MLRLALPTLITRRAGPGIGPELVTNGSNGFSSTTGYSAVGVSLAVVANELEITALDGTSDRTEFTFSGLTIGAQYQVTYTARRVTGADCFVGSWTWATWTTGSLTGTSPITVERTVQATAATGVSRFYAAGSADTGLANDRIILSNFSVRQIL